jgi:tripeptidyl-peptidase-1
MFRPSPETEEAVKQWLIDSGIASERVTHSENKAWFAFDASADEAENLLHTEFHEFEDSISGGVMPACDKYHVPKHISKHIDYITPGIKLLAPPESHRAKRAAIRNIEMGLSPRVTHNVLANVGAASTVDSSDLSTCDIAITPACVAALYQIPPATSANPNNSMGIFESELQFWTQLDLDLFFTNFTSIPNGTHPIAANIDGGQQATDDLYEAGGEVNLDLMLAYPIVYPQTITDYEVDDFIVQANQNDTYTFGFNTFLDALDGVSHKYSHQIIPILIGLYSHIAHSRHTTKLVMILTLTRNILIRILAGIRDH